MIESPHMAFTTGELLEPVLQAEFRHVLEAAGLLSREDLRRSSIR